MFRKCLSAGVNKIKEYYDRIEDSNAYIMTMGEHLTFFCIESNRLHSSAPGSQTYALYQTLGKGLDTNSHRKSGSHCYTLSHPETRQVSVTALWAVGLRRVQSSIPSIIMIILFTHPSLNPIPLRISCFQTLLRFMFPFYFAFLFPLFYFQSLNPNPDIQWLKKLSQCLINFNCMLDIIMDKLYNILKYSHTNYSILPKR